MRSRRWATTCGTASASSAVLADSEAGGRRRRAGMASPERPDCSAERAGTARRGGLALSFGRLLRFAPQGPALTLERLDGLGVGRAGGLALGRALLRLVGRAAADLGQAGGCLGPRCHPPEVHVGVVAMPL